MREKLTSIYQLDIALETLETLRELESNDFHKKLYN